MTASPGFVNPRTSSLFPKDFAPFLVILHKDFSRFLDNLFQTSDVIPMILHSHLSYHAGNRIFHP